MKDDRSRIRLRRTLPWFELAAAVSCLISQPVHAASATISNAPPALTAPVVTIDTNKVQSRLKELEASKEGEDSARQALIEVYRQILSREQDARGYEEKAAQFRQLIATGHEQVARLKAEIQTALTNQTAQVPGESETLRTAEEVRARLTQQQAELASLQSRLAEVEKQLKVLQDRPAALRAELAEARTMLAQIEKDLSAPAPAEGAGEAELAQRTLLEARHHARLAQIDMLNQELVSAPLQEELLTAQRDRLNQLINAAQAQIQALDRRLARLTQEETEQARREAERLRREALGKHPLVQAQTEELTRITHELQELGRKSDQARKTLAEAETQLNRLKADAEETQRMLDLGGDEENLGAVLLEQRRALVNPARYAARVKEFAEQRTQARLRLFQVDRQLKQLTDLNAMLEQLLAQAAGVTNETDQATLREQLQKVLQAKRSQWEQLAGVLRTYQSDLGRLEATYRELAQQTTQLAQLLDEHLIWIHNAAVLNAAWLTGLTEDVAWFLEPDHWREVVQNLEWDISRALGLWVLAAVLAMALAAGAPRMHRRLVWLAEPVRKLRTDRFGYTLEALMWTVALGTLWALPLLFVGWRLKTAGTPGTFGYALGCSVVAVGALVGIDQFLRELVRPKGLGEAHFRWSAGSLASARRELLWFGLVAAPCVFAYVFTLKSGESIYGQRIGRLAFLVLMLATAALTWRLFDSQRGLSLQLRHGVAPKLLMRTRPVWRVVLVLLPMTMAVLAALGYTFLAYQFTHRLLWTVVLAESVVIVFAVVYRWVVLSQRRLALRLAMERREAEARSREAADLETAQDGVLEMLEEIDVAEVKEQTLDILQICVGVALLVGFWLTWSGVLPAFGFLSGIKVWDHSVMVDGQIRRVPITLADLLASLAMLALTVVAARNMPGLLEISLLQRLPMDPGTRYATRTLCLYAIVTLGLILVFRTLGIGWSSVQWLVAALTVGLGFGLQEIFANFVSGLIILVERPIRVGDTVTVGSISGVVTRIRMRATTITDWNRKELIVPNKNFITGELINWTLSDPMLRMDFLVGIAYGSDTRLAQQVMLEVCRAHPQVLKQPEPNVFFVGFGDNSLNFEVRVFITEQTNTGRTRILHDLHMGIDQACRKHNITIAFPQRDLHLKTAEATLRVMQVPYEPPAGDGGPGARGEPAEKAKARPSSPSKDRPKRREREGAGPSSPQGRTR